MRNCFFFFGCVVSSFLCEGFLQLRQVGATLHHSVRASHYRGPSRCGAQAPDAQAQQVWLTGPVALRHVGSSQTRLEPVSPALAGRFSTTALPGKPREAFFKQGVGILFSKSNCGLRPCSHASLDFPQAVIFILLSLSYTPCHPFPHQQMVAFSRPRNILKYVLSSKTFSQECHLCLYTAQKGVSQDEIIQYSAGQVTPAHTWEYVYPEQVSNCPNFSKSTIESNSSFLLNPSS